MNIGKSILKALSKAIFGTVLVLLLTACSSTIAPPTQQLVEQAIALQLNQTQAELSQQLRMAAIPGKIKPDRVTITAQDPVTIEGLSAYRVQGSYDFTVQSPQRQSRPNNRFELYLQRQKEGKTWRLARLTVDETGDSIWVTQQIQPLK
jgi:hypothetical protein